MPFSDRFKCVFLHNPKAGGTTIEQLLEIPKKPEFLLSYKYENPNSSALQHLTYHQLVSRIPDKMENYFKFTFVRNPWDKLVSTYSWRNRGKKTFEEFIDFVDDLFKKTDPTLFHTLPDFAKLFLSHLFPQYFYDGEGVTVYRFEDFNNETQKLLGKLGISKSVPIVNKSNHRHYSEYYTPRTREIVGRIYATDILLYNYKFEGKPVVAITPHRV